MIFIRPGVNTSSQHYQPKQPVQFTTVHIRQQDHPVVDGPSPFIGYVKSLKSKI